MATPNTCDACCGPPPCDFATVSNSSGYTVVSGSWTNTVTSDADALAVINTSHPAGAEGSLAMSATIQGTALGDKLRIIPKYIDANNYVAVEFEFGDSTNCGLMRVITHTAGSDTVEGDDQPISVLVNTSGHSVKVFYKVTGSNALVYVQVQGVRTFARTITHLPASHFAFGTSTLTGEASFGTIQIGGYLTANDCPVTPDCMIHDISLFGTKSCEWDIRSGSWSISGSTLTCTSAGVVVSEYPNWTSDDTIAIEAYPACSNASTIIGIVFDYLDDDNYHLATVTGTTTLAIVKRTAGVNTTLVSRTFSGARQPGWYICVREGNITFRISQWGGVSFPAYLVSAQTTLHGGKSVGFSAETVSGGSPATFDDLKYSLAISCGDAASDERPCAMCAPCVDGISSTTDGTTADLPKGWKLVISGVTGPGGCATACSNLFNGTFTLPGFGIETEPLGGISDVACRAVLRRGQTSCDFISGLKPVAICLIARSDQLEVELGEDGWVHTGKWVYTLSEAEQCDLTTIVDAQPVPDSLVNSHCTVSGATILITALAP